MRSHYPPEEWIDFLRGILSGEERGRMSAHRDGCGECRRTLSLLESAAQLARADREFEPPPSVVAEAEAIFSPRYAPASGGLPGSRLRRLVANLEWDSFGGALPAGVRSLREDARHAVYRAAQYSIDLIFDLETPPDGMVLTGQVADELAPGVFPGEFRPILLSGNEVIARATSTEFGEFSLRYRAGRPLSLRIPLERSGEYIEVPLISSEPSNLFGPGANG